MTFHFPLQAVLGNDVHIDGDYVFIQNFFWESDIQELRIYNWRTGEIVLVSSAAGASS